MRSRPGLQCRRALRAFDPEGRSTASSDWVRFGQKRPGIQALGQSRQPAALRLEQRLEQRCKKQGMARDTRKPRLSRAFSHSGGGIRTRDLRVMGCIDRRGLRSMRPFRARLPSLGFPRFRSDWYANWYATRMMRNVGKSNDRARVRSMALPQKYACAVVANEPVALGSVAELPSRPVR